MAKKNKGPSQRTLRVGEMVRHALAEVLLTERLEGSPVPGGRISISEVRMSPDLKIATAFVAPLGIEDGVSADDLCKVLARNAATLRMKAAPRLDHMRALPNLRFRPDTSFENFARIDKLLRSPEVARDLEPGPARDAARLANAKEYKEGET